MSPGQYLLPGVYVMVSPSLQLDNKYSIDIWLVELKKMDKDTSSLLNILDDTEQQRYHRLHRNHRHRYLLSHAACRNILSRYTGYTASEIQYTLNTHGKPGLINSPFTFNLSHSHDLAIIVIGAGTEIGVDVEYIKPKPNWKKLAKRFFNTDEYSYLLQQAENHQLESFFQLWTRKEAFIKALGTGLSTPLKSFDSSHAEQIKIDDADNCWYQKDLTLDSAYKGCVVQNTKIKKIRYYVYA